MTRLSREATERLLTAGCDLDLLAALVETGALRRINDHAFQIPCETATGSACAWFWAVGAEPLPWEADQRPAAWWPVGRDGSTAIVVVGAEAGLAVASLLFHAGDDGKVRRRANLPGVLARAVPVVLPETCTEIPVEWISSDEAPRELVDLLGNAGCSLAFLALTLEPAEYPPTEIAVRAFVDACAAAASDLTIAPVFLPGNVSLADSYQEFHGHGRKYGLAAVLNFWRLVAENPPQQPEESE